MRGDDKCTAGTHSSAPDQRRPPLFCRRPARVALPRSVPLCQAYFYGFWKAKRIVLYDTLISQNTEPQVLAVLGTTQAHLHHRAALLGWPVAALIVGREADALARRQTREWIL